MKPYHLDDIHEILQDHDFAVMGNATSVSFRNAKSLEEADAESLVWISSQSKNKLQLIEKTAARLIVCPRSIDIPEHLKQQKCFILSDNPKLIFSLIVGELLVEKPPAEIHQSAFVHPDAVVAPDVYIGPFSYIGKCNIDAGSIIWGNCYLYDRVTLGKFVEIHAGCVIGGDGSGYAKNDRGEWIKFPHIGGTILEDYVEVGTNSYINKGALGNTHIKKGAKIGNSVCIGHNVVIDENAIVIANTVVAGSSYIGKGAYIGPSAVIRNQSKIGANATVGMGAVVLKDVEDNTTVIGNPAATLTEYRKWSRLKARLFEMFGNDKNK